MQFDLKPVSQSAIPDALERAHRYRLLNEPWQAESICLDVLNVDPGNQTAAVTLLLALTDQFCVDSSPAHAREVLLARPAALLSARRFFCRWIGQVPVFSWSL
jgi:hypothetical protein